MVKFLLVRGLFTQSSTTVTRTSMWSSFCVHPDLVELGGGFAISARAGAVPVAVSSMSALPADPPMDGVANLLHRRSQSERQLAIAVGDLRSTPAFSATDFSFHNCPAVTLESVTSSEMERNNRASILDLGRIAGIAVLIRSLSEIERHLADKTVTLRTVLFGETESPPPVNMPRHAADTALPLPTRATSPLLSATTSAHLSENPLRMNFANGPAAVAPFFPSVRSDEVSTEVRPLPQQVSESAEAKDAQSPPHPLDDFISSISAKRAFSPFEDVIAAVSGPSSVKRRFGPPPPPERFRVRVAPVGRPHRATKRNYDYFEELTASIDAITEQRPDAENNREAT
jgi:hypothetical protein